MFASDNDALTHQMRPARSCIIPQQSFIPLTWVMECGDRHGGKSRTASSTHFILLSPAEPLVQKIYHLV